MEFEPKDGAAQAEVGLAARFGREEVEEDLDRRFTVLPEVVQVQVEVKRLREQSRWRILEGGPSDCLSECLNQPSSRRTSEGGSERQRRTKSVEKSGWPTCKR